MEFFVCLKNSVNANRRIVEPRIDDRDWSTLSLAERIRQLEVEGPYCKSQLGDWRADCRIVEMKMISTKGKRFVFLGDSITDHDIFTQFVYQALDLADVAPVVINAGVGSNTACDMKCRLERDVLAHAPDTVVLSAGVNDAYYESSPSDFAAEIIAIARRLKEEGISLLLLTTTIFGSGVDEAGRELKHQEKLLDSYNGVLHQLAREFDCRIAEVNSLFKTARSAGRQVLSSDNVHPSFEGHRLIARAILDALGLPHVAIPEELSTLPAPGIIQEWRFKVAADDEPLDAEAVRELIIDSTWRPYCLPEPKPLSNERLEEYRRRGFGVSLDKYIGSGTLFRGVADIEAVKPQSMIFSVGAELQKLWLNHELIYQGSRTRGYHAGRERVQAMLRAGSNRIVIETGARFFLSVTP